MHTSIILAVYILSSATMQPFRGTYTVLITPFSEDGVRVDVGALRRLVSWQIAQGIHGLIPLGSTGEFLSMTRDERTLVIETVVSEARGRVPVLIGTGVEWTDEAVALSREAEALKADGVMVIPPFYSTPTADELFVHYRRIGEAIGIPIMIYNNPATANVDLTPPLVARLATIDNVRLHQGVDARGDPRSRHSGTVRRRLKVFAGSSVTSRSGSAPRAGSRSARTYSPTVGQLFELVADRKAWTALSHSIDGSCRSCDGSAVIATCRPRKRGSR